MHSRTIIVERCTLNTKNETDFVAIRQKIELDEVPQWKHSSATSVQGRVNCHLTDQSIYSDHSHLEHHRCFEVQIPQAVQGHWNTQNG